MMNHIQLHEYLRRDRTSSIEHELEKKIEHEGEKIKL